VLGDVLCAKSPWGAIASIVVSTRGTTGRRVTRRG